MVVCAYIAIWPRHLWRAKGKEAARAQLISSAELILVQSLDRLIRRGDTRDDSAEILFQSFPAVLAWEGISNL